MPHPHAKPARKRRQSPIFGAATPKAVASSSSRCLASEKKLFAKAATFGKSSPASGWRRSKMAASDAAKGSPKGTQACPARAAAPAGMANRASGSCARDSFRRAAARADLRAPACASWSPPPLGGMLALLHGRFGQLWLRIFNQDRHAQHGRGHENWPTRWLRERCAVTTSTSGQAPRMDFGLVLKGAAMLPGCIPDRCRKNDSWRRRRVCEDDDISRRDVLQFRRTMRTKSKAKAGASWKT